jgi:hypothetical protein
MLLAARTWLTFDWTCCQGSVRTALQLHLFPITRICVRACVRVYNYVLVRAVVRVQR